MACEELRHILTAFVHSSSVTPLYWLVVSLFTFMICLCFENSTMKFIGKYHGEVETKRTTAEVGGIDKHVSSWDWL